MPVDASGSPTQVRSDLAAQREHVDKIKSEGFDFGLIVGAAFVRGIRDIGYKSTATALDELIDNSIQAEAANVDVVFGFDGKSQAKPARLAVIDDGHGMDPDMIRLSVIWGGTHREDDRTGFGRYGYGLPSACISQGRRFSVYSRTEDGDWHRVTLDLGEIAAGSYLDPNSGRIIVPEPRREDPPSWVMEHPEMRGVRALASGLTHGTVVVIEELDRLSWRTTRVLERKLLEHFGVTYRNFLRQVGVTVQGKVVEALDPLFTTAGGRFYDLDDDRAEALEPLAIEVKDRESRKPLGVVHVRFSYLAPTFGREPEDKLKARGRTNARFDILKEHNGIVVLRNGRQIDVVTRCPWTSFQNNDRYWKVEVDFPATLDEEFSVTTSKQQIVLSDRMWELLKQHGVYRAIQALRHRGKRERSELDAKRDQAESEKRASEQAMEEAQTFRKQRPGADSLERKKRIQERFDREVQRRAKESGQPPEEVERQLEAETQQRPYKVGVELMPGAPFFRVEQLGGQEILWLNSAHRFYQDVYAGPDSTPRLRAGLELVLFVIGDCELDAADDCRVFYEVERGVWSTRLHVALDRLSRISDIDDDLAAAAQADEDEVREGHAA